MFKVRTLDNTSNLVLIQGAYSANSNVDIAQLILQNYDNDTAKFYNMGSITVRDHFGDSNNNGLGDLLFKTSEEGSNLYERMRITYDGKIGVGTANPDRDFVVQGDAKITGSLITSDMSLSNVFVTSNIAIGTSNPRTALEVRGGDILAKNFVSLTKTTNSLNALDINIHWNNPTSSNQYFILLETTSQVANGTLSGFRRQRLAIKTQDSDPTSPSLQAVESAVSFGNLAAYNTMNIVGVYSNANTFTLRSSNSWGAAGNLHHSFTVNLALGPDAPSVNNIYFS
jgi:hypothetical protein